MSDPSRVPALAAKFAAMSILAVGGINAGMPELQRQLVEVDHWMTGRQFAELFAVAQAAPGPNLIISTVIGWHVAGPLGALVATLAISGPSSVLVYAVSGVWEKMRDRPWQAWVRAGMAPVVVGLVGSSGYLLSKGADADWRGAVVTAISATLIWRTRLNPLWLLAGGALLGVAGLV